MTPPEINDREVFDSGVANGIAVHSEIPSIGSFECSDLLINQLQHNIVWGQKGNFVDVPTDCPQRDERMGWTGDAQVFLRTAAFNRDVAGFFTKWTRDLQDAQSDDGAYPPVAPNLPAWSIGKDGGPAWADAGIICPWMIYLSFGDRRLFEEHYPSMQRYIEFLSQTSQDGLRCYDGYTGWRARLSSGALFVRMGPFKAGRKLLMSLLWNSTSCPKNFVLWSQPAWCRVFGRATTISVQGLSVHRILTGF